MYKHCENALFELRQGVLQKINEGVVILHRVNFLQNNAVLAQIAHLQPNLIQNSG